MLSLATWLPLIGAILVLFVPDQNLKAARGLAIGVALATMLVSLAMVMRFDATSFKFQFTEFIPWISSAGVNYSLGVDGISLWMVPLTALLTIIALGFSSYVEHRAKLFLALVLVLETAMIGTFLSLDLILFYTFFELSLVPMYFLVALWGGEGRRRAAAKFFIYTFAGSIFMLVGMVTLAYLHQQATGKWSFSIVDIQAAVSNGSLWANAVQAQPLIFWAFAIAFLVKAPGFPFHTWIPDTYAESPVAGPILSSAMVKMGSYGLLRFCLPLFPDVIRDQVPVIMALAVIGILYGAILAAVQPDMRRMLAYSTVSHMGFVILGIFSLDHIGLVGGSYQQISHGLTASALFLLVGFLLQRRGTTEFRAFGGLKAQMPMFATLFLISMLASVGLPGLSGFIGEFLSLLGAYKSGYSGLAGYGTIYVALAGGGVVLAAVYLLYMYQQVFYGPVTSTVNARLRDLKGWEAGLAGVLVVAMIWGGVYPSTFTKPMEVSLQATRQMALNQDGQKPTWAGDQDLVITGVALNR
jgi:NADH-quinone oxidoreductase subunit M